MKINMLDCNICQEDKSLSLVGVSNFTNKLLKFELKGLEEAPVGFCPDRDPSAIQSSDGFSTRLLPRDISLNPIKKSLSVKTEAEELGIYSLEIDGERLEGLSEQEMVEELFKRDFLMVIKKPYRVPCSGIESISNFLSISYDLDYSNGRSWDLIVNEEYIGSTGSYYSYVENMSNIFPGLFISFSNSLDFRNTSENPLYIQLIASTTSNIREDFLHTENPSFIYDIQAGSISFCLGVHF